MIWHSLDPRYELHRVPQMAWLNRWLVKHPFRGPVIGFIFAGIFIGLSFIPGMDKLIYLAIFPFLIATLLLIYTLVRKILSTTFVENEDVWEEPSSETPIKVDEQARQRAVESWRRRSRQDRHRRRNPSGW